MAQKKLHTKFNTIILLPLFLLAGWYIKPDLNLLAIFSATFIYATLFAHPDVDLCNQVKLFSFEGLMTLPFRFLYSPFFKHRGRISHSFLWGTPSRLFCLIIFILILIFLMLCFSQLINHGLTTSGVLNIIKEIFNVFIVASSDLKRFLLTYKIEVLTTIISFYCADFGHLLIDRLGK